MLQPNPNPRFLPRALFATTLIVPIVITNWHQTFAILLFLAAAAARAAFTGAITTPKKAITSLSTTIILGLLIAFALHYSAAKALDDSIRIPQLLFSALFFAGAVALLEAAELLLTSLTRDHPPIRRAIIRLILVLIILPPTLIAVLQTTRVKSAYQLPKWIRNEDTTTFHAKTSDHQTIRGYFINRNKNATIIIAHGLGAHSRNFAPRLADLINQTPTNGLLFDFRAHGYSTGHTSSFGIHEQKDAGAVIDWLIDNHPDAAKNIILVGFSMGAAAITPIAYQYPQVKAIFLISTYNNITNDVAKPLISHLPNGLNQYVLHTALPLASAFAQADLANFNPGYHHDKLADQIIIERYHGSNDKLIPLLGVQQSQTSQKVPINIIQNAGHVDLFDKDATLASKIARSIRLAITPDKNTKPTQPQISAPD